MYSSYRKTCTGLMGSSIHARTDHRYYYENWSQPCFLIILGITNQGFWTKRYLMLRWYSYFARFAATKK
jgi:hypothetical protein